MSHPGSPDPLFESLARLAQDMFHGLPVARRRLIEADLRRSRLRSALNRLVHLLETGEVRLTLFRLKQIEELSRRLHLPSTDQRLQSAKEAMESRGREFERQRRRTAAMLTRLVDRLGSDLPPSEREWIQHMMNHREFGLAYEALLGDVMSHANTLSRADFDAVDRLGTRLRVDPARWVPLRDRIGG